MKIIKMHLNIILGVFLALTMACTDAALLPGESATDTPSVQIDIEGLAEDSQEFSADAEEDVALEEDPDPANAVFTTDGGEDSTTGIAPASNTASTSEGSDNPDQDDSDANDDGNSGGMAEDVPTRIAVSLYVHSEDQYHPDTPDLSQNKSDYVTFRNAIVTLAEALNSRNVPLDFQSDYNFLLGVKNFEVDNPDQTLLASTGGQNVLNYLESLGALIETHSHQNDGYNLTDVNYLQSLIGGTRQRVIGGVRSTEEDWTVYQQSHVGNKYNTTWQFDMLTAPASVLHKDDVRWTGIFRPASPQDFFSEDASSNLPCVGNWDATPDSLMPLVEAVESGALPPGKLYTASLTLNHSDLANGGSSYLETLMAEKIDPLVDLRDASRIQLMNFPAIRELWQGEYQASGFACVADGTGSPCAVKVETVATNTGTTISAPDLIYTMFSINVQDFAYPQDSSAVVNRVIDLHEELGLPVSIYLNESILAVYEGDYPETLERLKTSAMVSVSYHIRPPKPYHLQSDWFDWSGMDEDAVYDTVYRYETHRLDLATGETTDAPGGYQHLADLLGYKPWSASSLAQQELLTTVNRVFKDLGAIFTVKHGGTSNLGDIQNGLYIRPEHFDLKVFEETREPEVFVEDAIAQAQVASGAKAPYFVGVKMHDNDFFATQSAWLTTFIHRDPPYDLSVKADPLSDAEQEAMWERYEGTVRYVAGQSDRIKAVSLKDVYAMITGTDTAATDTASKTEAQNGDTSDAVATDTQSGGTEKDASKDATGTGVIPIPSSVSKTTDVPLENDGLNSDTFKRPDASLPGTGTDIVKDPDTSLPNTTGTGVDKHPDTTLPSDTGSGVVKDLKATPPKPAGGGRIKDPEDATGTGVIPIPSSVSKTTDVPLENDGLNSDTFKRPDASLPGTGTDIVKDPDTSLPNTTGTGVDKHPDTTLPSDTGSGVVKDLKATPPKPAGGGRIKDPEVTRLTEPANSNHKEPAGITVF